VVLPVPPWLLAVVVSVGASAFTVAGFVLQKRALRDPRSDAWPKFGDVVLSPCWVMGFLITATIPILGDLAAYSLAPLSLTAPLSGVSVILNMVIAPWALSEQLQRFPDAPATGSILLGCVATTVFGDHDRTGPLSTDDLVRLSTRPPFLCILLIGGFAELAVLARMRRQRAEIEKLAAERQDNPHMPHVVLPALAAAICGAVANIGLKGISEILKVRSSVFRVIACAVPVVPAAVAQVNFINRGLFLYPQSVFMSVYGALLVLTNTVCGAVFYEEYPVLLRSSTRFFLFAFGCFLIILGIWMFKLRGTGKKDDAMLDLNNFGCNRERGEHDVTTSFGKRRRSACDDDSL